MLRNGITIPKGRYYSKEFENTLINIENIWFKVKYLNLIFTKKGMIFG